MGLAIVWFSSEFVYLINSNKHHTQKDADKVLAKIQRIKYERLQQKPGASLRLEDDETSRMWLEQIMVTTKIVIVVLQGRVKD